VFQPAFGHQFRHRHRPGQRPRAGPRQPHPAELGKGARFIFTLPASTDATQPDTKA
jgi:hypothetical protein